jgi:hypothetical protein
MKLNKLVFVSVAVATMAIPSASFADSSANTGSTAFSGPGGNTATVTGGATGNGVFETSASTPTVTASLTNITVVPAPSETKTVIDRTTDAFKRAAAAFSAFIRAKMGL